MIVFSLDLTKLRNRDFIKKKGRIVEYETVIDNLPEIWNNHYSDAYHFKKK